MPTYEFRCPDGTLIERIYKISEVPAEIPSPNGDGMAVRIISGGAALLFKGSGFYITDYGKDGKKDQRTSGGDGAGTTGGSSSTEGKSSGEKSSGGSSPTESKSSGEKSSSDKPSTNKPSTDKSSSEKSTPSASPGSSSSGAATP